mgnify:CR=1 FL=1
MNKKAFTITEVLATLVILGIIVAIAIPSVNKLNEKFEKEYYDKLDKTIIESAKLYIKDNPDKRPINILESFSIDYQKLKDKYLDNIKGYKNSDSISGKVVVVKTNDGYEYKNCYSLNGQNKYTDSDSYCNFSDSDHIEYDYGDLNNDNLYLHVGNYTQDEIREALKVGKYAVRKSETGKELYKVPLDEDNIYPKNITAIDTSTTGTYKVSYSISTSKDTISKDISKNLIVFQHPAPVVKTDGMSKLYFGFPADINIDTETFNKKYNSKFYNYEYSHDFGKSWLSLSCYDSNTTCKQKLDYKEGKIRFRVVGKGQDGKNHYGKESSDYDIKERLICTTSEKWTNKNAQLTVSFEGNTTRTIKYNNLGSKITKTRYLFGSNNPLVLKNLSYYQINVTGIGNNKDQISKTCTTNYDNLEPYPCVLHNVVKANDDKLITKIETNCDKDYETSIATAKKMLSGVKKDYKCTATVYYKSTLDSEATSIIPSWNLLIADQDATNKSGKSNVYKTEIIYTYEDGEKCTDYYRNKENDINKSCYGKPCSEYYNFPKEGCTSEKKVKETTFINEDLAGNRSKPATIIIKYQAE